MKFEVFNRFSLKLQFTAEISCSESASIERKRGEALKWAYLEGANLKWADLKWANLEGADLKGADLKWAYLEGADLKGAYLEGANLEGANLKGANLEGANLKGANLKWANLKWADLKWANLKGANLEGADLKWADLEGANLKGANLKEIKNDLYYVLDNNQAEVAPLLETLKAGKIDGTVYSGQCACLMGTIANIKHCDVDILEKRASSSAERWFLAIGVGMTPENNVVAKITAQWIQEWLDKRPKSEAA